MRSGRFSRALGCRGLRLRGVGFRASGLGGGGELEGVGLELIGQVRHLRMEYADYEADWVTSNLKP